MIGHLGVLGVVKRLERLGHHTVVGSNDQDHDIGDLGATGTHLGKGLVARSIEEDDVPTLRR